MLRTFLTTSRNPSLNLISFTKKLINLFPQSKKINRGRKFLTSLISYCVENEVKNLLVIYELKGNPNCLIISHLPSGPSVYFKISNYNILIFKNDINIFFSDLPILLISNLNTPIGSRISKIITNLYPKSSNNSKRIISYVGLSNNIVCNQYLFQKKNYNNENMKLKNIGPRFFLRPFKIILGNISEINSNVEWIITTLIQSKRRMII
ncbi:U3 snoRNP protein IMP4 (nucleomorph) [Guillardia theta]|uniref:U3 snoRNP protein IMP4 n=1 Tax=Guillardia theta TaxID=55529 RepID=Q98RR9_GUITH|nr:U3 snoRNP protein IMP4 [Guillardia theta]AAK39878.1 U3 snoRNP protein IMP4 [Guillardia theta]|mmetsp:Transcript_40486/g.127481  ORF Transcript_40486/g.127481 Transcript_40486/m.127481 type:complete len:208 (-) Transcript_40486:384-1007(-)